MALHREQALNEQLDALTARALSAEKEMFRVRAGLSSSSSASAAGAALPSTTASSTLSSSSGSSSPSSSADSKALEVSDVDDGL
jgi:hypothetical protein